jgi:phospholipid/cholesterol/gamma-HCH transport system substrate-binding protein
MNTNIKSAILYSTGLCLLIFGMLFLKRVNIFKSNYTLFAKFSATGGLNIDDPILINGVKVGVVRNIDIIKDGVLVHLEINNTKVTIPQDSKATITSQSLIGGKSISLAMGALAEQVKNKDTLKSENPKDFAQILKQYEPMLNNTEVLVHNFNNVLLKMEIALDAVNGVIKQNEQSVAVMLTHLTQISGSIQNTILPNLNETLNTYKASIPAQNLNHIVVQLDETTGNLAQITKRLTTADNTFGKLLTQDEMYIQVQQTLAQIKDLVGDLKENPHRYVHVSVFGTKSPEVRYKNKIEGMEAKEKYDAYLKNKQQGTTTE